MNNLLADPCDNCEPDSTEDCAACRDNPERSDFGLLNGTAIDEAYERSLE